MAASNNKYLLKIKPIKDNGFYNEHRLAYEGDAGVDLFVPHSIYIPPKAISHKTSLNACFELVNKKTNKSISYYVYQRSSMTKTPLRYSCGVGIIDREYRGELHLIVDNLADEGYFIEAGTKLLQICVPNLKPMDVMIVDELSFGIRGDKGFGSSN